MGDTGEQRLRLVSTIVKLGVFSPFALYKQAHLLKCYEIWHEACMLKGTFSEGVLTVMIDIVTS